MDTLECPPSTGERNVRKIKKGYDCGLTLKAEKPRSASFATGQELVSSRMLDA